MWFTKVSLKNPVFATMVMLAIVVLGVFSYQRLKVEQFPNVDFPIVIVIADYPGAAPEIVESEVTKKIEDAVNSISGISALTSRSYEGTSVVSVEFQLSIDGRKAAEDVREKVASVRPLLRTEVKEPRVLRFDPASRPVWSLAVLPEDGAGGGSARSAMELTAWAEQTLKKRLENVRGVGAVNLVGATRREINVYLNPQALEAFGVAPEEVVSAVQNENQDLPLGAIRSLTQERLLRIDARMQRPEDFGRIIVARRNGAPVRLEQVARVHDGAQELEDLALYNGQRTLLLTVQKAQDENTIEVVDGLNAAVAELRGELPPGVRLEAVGDTARPIRVAVNNVRHTLIEGAALTVLIVFLFLNSWRSTVITGLTLPIALIGTFLFMHLFGFSINMVTLMALSLCVGLLIDDAIVVRENIVRHVQMGKGAYAAAMDGTQEIGLAVLATTLSIVAVFLPIGFMGGIIGKFFHEFGITIVVAVLLSMFVSFTLDPMLSSVWHDPSIHVPGQRAAPRTWYDKSIGRVTGWFEYATEALAGGYQRILRWSLLHKIATLAIALGTFVLSLFMLPLLGTEFVPKADFSESVITFYTPVGSSLEATEAKARQVEGVLRALPEVRYTLTTINTGNVKGKNYAGIFVRLVDRKERSRSVEQMSGVLREHLAQVAGITVTHVGLLDPVGGQKQIEFSLKGPDQQELERLAARAVEELRGIPGLVDLDSSAKLAKPVIALEVRRDAASDLGLDLARMAAALRTLVAGTLVGSWRAPDDQTYDVNVRLAPEARSTVEDLERLPFALTATDGSTRIVRLNQLARVVESTGANQITRRDMTREVAVNANTAQRAAGEVSADIREALDAMVFPPGYRYQFGGSTKNMAESFGYATSALVLAVIFIYMILASQFKSFLQPLALMSSLPLTLTGVVLALLVFHSTLSMFSVIGVVMLMGLVTKNAILLVDFAIRARQEHLDDQGRSVAGLPRTEALLLAARVRLRPIIMTTLAMIFGMVPLAFALSEGSEQRAPMGQAVIGGVITSSLLTLVVVPVVYCYMDDLARWALRGFRRAAAEPDVREAGH
ncbi:efflux RND transporter permease subunit [Verminephrobacter aporrectodeae subsp. tuberculatae]|uniref:efflux RND transporter permease subunit n=1 Tax=Verminephrobacter aporrectodeae TaxID=1110389 RepID=UPI002242D603|nr:efflux RND transporter permease subunit [Verminephrobacter aporrectodeae]MCW8163914.1 efflux RND transporter permease subunit [Verminephrobacter aporrectodeae subsp. tuberculatae]MCW8168148.1 efflux RND transporter permease subunit [Verminephrobacter aporrectodeae subsp. tuberculatae]